MKFIASYIMRGPAQAILVVSVTGILSLLLPLFSYISGAAVGLVTLRVGPAKGVTTSLASAAAVALLAGLLWQLPLAGPALLLGAWLPVWGLALSLRRTVSLSRTILLAGLFGAGLVLGFHVVSDDPAAWWLGFMQELLGQQGATLSGEQSEALTQLGRVMTGILGAAFSLSALGCLLLARWWQALLYNPGGFREEFHGLRLGRNLTVVTAILLVGAAALSGPAAAVALDLLIVALAMHVLQGIAVVHGLVGRTGSSVGWLIGMYGLLVIAMPQTVITLALAGFVDSWFDFRTYFGARDKG
jgi:hypothetical protein